MNDNYHFNSFYAQERISAQLKAAESHRLAQQANGDSRILATAGRAYDWVGRLSSQLAHSLETLGEFRIAPFQR
jgi:hypothetical protein